MNEIVFGVFFVVSLTLISLVGKHLRMNNVPVKAILSMTFFALPLWASFLGYFIFQKKIIFSIEYATLVFLWVAAVFTLTSINIFLFKYRSLSQLQAFGMGFSTVIALVVDILLFQYAFSTMTLIAGTFLIIGASILSGKRKKSNSLPSKKVIALLLVNACLTIAAFSIYKKALALQPFIFTHVVLIQLGIHGIFFVVGGKCLFDQIRKRAISYKQVVLVSSLIFIGTIFEGYTLKSFPVLIVYLLAVIPIVFYSLYDLKKKELKLNGRTISAFCLVLLGLALLSITST